MADPRPRPPSWFVNTMAVNLFLSAMTKRVPHSSQRILLFVFGSETSSYSRSGKLLLSSPVENSFESKELADADRSVPRGVLLLLLLPPHALRTWSEAGDTDGSRSKASSSSSSQLAMSATHRANTSSPPMPMMPSFSIMSLLRVQEESGCLTVTKMKNPFGLIVWCFDRQRPGLRVHGRYMQRARAGSGGLVSRAALPLRNGPRDAGKWV